MYNHVLDDTLSGKTLFEITNILNFYLSIAFFRTQQIANHSFNALQERMVVTNLLLCRVQLDCFGTITLRNVIGLAIQRAHQQQRHQRRTVFLFYFYLFYL
jgi:hypothetical protein